VSQLVIPQSILAQIITHAQREAPKEACGLISGRDGAAVKAYPITNTDQSNVTYLMDPKEQFAAFKEMRQAGTELLAIYHSHPATEAYPSPTDKKLAFYPEAYYVIISLAQAEPVVRAYTNVNGDVK
jgi:proteasome lid subunit RPN8/RPN11